MKITGTLHRGRRALTTVLGIGNLVHSDDDAGLHAVKVLREDARVPQNVTIIEGGILGLELLPYLEQARRILFVDAIDVGEKPGTIIRPAGSAMDRLAGRWNVHRPGGADLLRALRLVRSDDSEITILGVQPGSIHGERIFPRFFSLGKRAIQIGPFVSSIYWFLAISIFRYSPQVAWTDGLLSNDQKTRIPAILTSLDTAQSPRAPTQ